jgi:hypothetical protein
VARQVARHLVSALFRQRIPVWAGSVHFYRSDGTGHVGVDARGGAEETSSTLMRMAVYAHQDTKREYTGGS